MKRNILFVSLFMLSCTARQHDIKGKTIPFTDTSTGKPLLADTLRSTEIIETFTDSLHIGEKGTCKIELIKHRVYDDTYVIVRFYTKGPRFWYIQNTYLYECNAPALEPNVSDFNNDKFNDITFISAIAARGANEIRRLFIYDNNEKKLISIVNSENYPNMLYNNALNCIDAFLVYGGCSTVFLHIKGDSLKEFASVEAMDGITVREFNKEGEEKISFKDSTNKAGYIRFKTYKPLKEYREY